LIAPRITAFLGAVVIVVAFGLPLFVDLGGNDFKGDEPIYAFAIDRMLDQGDWLTPKSIPFDNVAFLEKPPLKFWLVAASVRAGLIPQNEFGYRVWDVLFGIAAFLYVYAIGVKMDGVVSGLTAVLVLFAYQRIVLDHGLRSNNMEAALVLSYCGGMFHALCWADATTRGRRWLHAISVGLWFVLGFMTKFVAAAFLPVVLIATAALSRRWRARLLEDWRAWTATTVLTAALILPWFVYQFHLRGREFWAVIFGLHIITRFTSYLDPKHVQPWYFYLTTFASDLSWAHDLILVCAGFAFLTFLAVRRHSDPAKLLLVWFLLPMAAISAGTSKLYHYAYPFVPPLALGAGLIPMAVIRTAQIRRDEISRLLERVWPPRRSDAIPLWLRRTLVTIAVIAVAVAMLTIIFGSVWIRIGGVTLFRNSTISRPLGAALVLMTVAGFFRLIPVALVSVLLIIVLPFDAYRNVRALEVAQVKFDGTPMKTLRDCLLRVQSQGAPTGVYVHTPEEGQWKYAYYLRDPGWRTDEAADDSKLDERLLSASGRRPVFMRQSGFESFRRSIASDASRRDDLVRLNAIPWILWDDGWMMLLPGPYGVCNAVRGGSVRTSG